MTHDDGMPMPYTPEHTVWGDDAFADDSDLCVCDDDTCPDACVCLIHHEELDQYLEEEPMSEDFGRPIRTVFGVRVDDPDFAKKIREFELSDQFSDDDIEALRLGTHPLIVESIAKPLIETPPTLREEAEGKGQHLHTSGGDPTCDICVALIGL